MMRLPTGMYQPGYSVIHGINAAVKLVCLILLLAAVVATDSVPGYVVSILTTAAIVYLAQISIPDALASVRRLLWFFVLILLMNTCFYGPDDPWVRWWIFCPSMQGLVQGMNVVLRVVLILILSNVLTTATAPLKLADGMERLLSPLRVIRVPTEQVAMIISVAIQFIPTIFEETDMIRKAQMARGARFDSRNYFEKAKAVMPLVIPIFLAAFKRADELSLAMEARGYRTDVSRAVKKREKLCAADFAALLVCAALCAMQTVVL